MPDAELLSAWISGLPGGPWYRRQELAHMLGVTRYALLRYKNHSGLGPVRTEHYGKLAVDLYDWETYQRLRAYIRSGAHDGRPPMWTPQELAERQRKGSSAQYYRHRAEQLTIAGEPEKAAIAAKKAGRLRQELDAQEHRRRRDLQRRRNRQRRGARAGLSAADTG